jgi:polysaccharide deacetylase family protein (PEP-CTERM system associated)
VAAHDLDAALVSSVLNALTFDVEDYFQVSALASAVDRAKWAEMPQRVVRNTHALYELLARTNTRATFFFLGWVVDRHPELVREAVAAGHEAACHGYSHQLIYNQTPQVFREETLRSKQLIEDQAQRPVLGYRAASYSITRKSLWALDILADAGFTYDSSIFPVRHDRYGIPDAPRAPHVLTAPGGKKLVEFPPSTTDIAGYRLPVAGGGYFRIFPYAVTKWAVKRVNAEGLPFNFYLHPWEIDPGQPRVPTRSRLSRFRHYTNLDVCMARLTDLIGRYRFGTMVEVLEQTGLLSRAEPRAAVAQEFAKPALSVG